MTISRGKLAALGHELRKNGYGQYLLRLADEAAASAAETDEVAALA